MSTLRESQARLKVVNAKADLARVIEKVGGILADLDMNTDQFGEDAKYLSWAASNLATANTHLNVALGEITDLLSLT